MPPVARLWRGYTTAANADEYEAMLKPELLPGVSKAPGFIESYLLRRPAGDEVEFITVMIFDSLESIRALAGTDYEKSIVPEERKRLLTRHDSVASHYELAAVCSNRDPAAEDNEPRP